MERIDKLNQELNDLHKSIENYKNLNDMFLATKFEKAGDDGDTLEYVVLKLEEMCKSELTCEDLIDPVFIPSFGLINKDEVTKIKDNKNVCDGYSKCKHHETKFEKVNFVHDLISLRNELLNKKSVANPKSKKDVHIDNLSGQVKRLSIQLNEKVKAYEVLK